jgi:hypothetical protein
MQIARPSMIVLVFIGGILCRNVRPDGITKLPTRAYAAD